MNIDTASADALERMADLVWQQHPSLDTMPLEPDGKYQTRTAGPYVLAESLFNPLQALIEAGYPPNRLHAIILDRAPASSLASWLDKWSDRAPQSTLVYNYVA